MFPFFSQKLINSNKNRKRSGGIYTHTERERVRERERERERAINMSRRQWMIDLEDRIREWWRRASLVAIY
jgi:hypothetical protein